MFWRVVDAPDKAVAPGFNCDSALAGF